MRVPVTAVVTGGLANLHGRARGELARRQWIARRHARQGVSRVRHKACAYAGSRLSRKGTGPGEPLLDGLRLQVRTPSASIQLEDTWTTTTRPRHPPPGSVGSPSPA